MNKYAASQTQKDLDNTIVTELSLIDAIDLTTTPPRKKNDCHFTNKVQTIGTMQPRATTQLNRQLRFTNDDVKLILFQIVRVHDANIVQQCKKDDAYETFLQTFWETVPASTRSFYDMPRLKSLRDKVGCLLTDGNAHVAYMSQQSGVNEESNDIFMLIDDFNQEIEDVETENL